MTRLKISLQGERVLLGRKRVDLALQERFYEYRMLGLVRDLSVMNNLA